MTIRLLSAVVFTMLIGTTMLANAQPAPAPEKAFIGNAGGDFGAGYEQFGGDGAARAYNEFFLAMKHWGRYELVANPARADWFFEIRVKSEQTCLDEWQRRRKEEQVINSYRIVLLMTDARTNTVRKRFSEPLAAPGLFSNREKIFDQVIVALIDDLKTEVGGTATKAPPVTHDEPPPPVPPEIKLAEKIYIHNRTASDNSGERYSGGGSQTNDQLALELKRWGRYQLVSAADADLDFEVSFSAPRQCNGLDDPVLQLSILDAKLDVALWSITSHIGHAFLESNARKNFTRGITDLVAVIRDVADRPTWALNASVQAADRASAITVAAAQLMSTPVPVTISAPATVKSGSGILALITVKNASKQDYTFTYASGDPLTCVITVKDSGGSMAIETEEGTRLKQAHESWHGAPTGYSLHPGEKQTRTCEVSSLYDMTRPGKYLIGVTSLDGRKVDANMAVVDVLP